MSWDVLQATLQSMDEVGPDGFEGLVATLLSELMGEEFLLARSGDQAGIDARSRRGTVVMQAKRYTSTRLTEAEVETDFHRSRRELLQLDVYVLAVTKSTAQLQTRLDQLGEETEIDVIALDWEGAIPALGALCVTFWQAILRFSEFGPLENQLGYWVAQQVLLPEVRKSVDSLREEIGRHLKSFTRIQQQATSFLERRFGFREPPLPRYRIDLPDAVHREAANALWDWWQGDASSIVLLQGGEGFGKSWIAAEFAWRVHKDAESMILWLESSDWQECERIEDALELALRNIGVRGDEEARRLVRKLTQRWSERVLLVLDGANELEALPAAEALIVDLSNPGAPRFRLLFTARHLEHYPNFNAVKWEGVVRIEAARFSSPEFEAALAGLTPPLRICDVPKGLVSAATIPRYFTTCMRLRDRLGHLDLVTHELVLWEDLLDKIQTGDEQTRRALGLTRVRDAAEVLQDLARNAPFEGTQPTVSFEVLNRVFSGRYADIRHDLEELRIATLALPQGASLSIEHVVLGFGLYLQKLVSSHGGTTHGIIDLVARTLEPLATADARTESVFVALQLTALRDPIPSEALSRGRAALLVSWMSFQNRQDVLRRLEFWVGTDVEAYAEFMDAFFEKLFSSAIQVDVVEPLARVWKKGGPEGGRLGRYIERWLLLTWDEKSCRNATEMEREGQQLPSARSEQHLRLSSIAVSLMSLRPEPKLLRALALCRATLDLSAALRHTPVRPGGTQFEETRFPIKRLEHMIGIVMRWCYTESVLPDLEKLARENADDPLLLRGVQELASSLRFLDLPQGLRLPSSPTCFPWHGVPAAQLIREQRSLFPARMEDGYPQEDQFGYLAAREDLPSLLGDDSEVVRQTFARIVSNGLPHYQRHVTSDDLQWDQWWPWYAKLFPRELSALVGRLRMAALATDQPFYTLHAIRGVLGDAARVSAHELRLLLEETASRFPDGSNGMPLALLLELWVLALLELSNDEAELTAWFDFAAGHVGLRSAADYSPTALLLPLLVPQRLSAMAYERTVGLAEEAARNPKARETAFDYWCCTAARTTTPAAERYEWVKNQVQSRKPSGDGGFHWLLLLFASAPADLLTRDLGAGLLENIFQDRSLRPMVWSSHALDHLVQAGCSYEHLMSWVPQDFVGGILLDAGRNEDFYRWGKELLSFSLKQAGHQPFTPSFRGENSYGLTPDGRVGYVSFKELTHSGQKVRGTSNTTGTDAEGTLPIDADERHEVFRREHEIWSKDSERLRAWEGSHLHDFSGRRALKAWRQRYSAEFLEFARLFLGRIVGDPRSTFHLNCFIDAVVCNLLTLVPAEAFQFYRELKKHPFAVNTHYGALSFLATLWDIQDCALPAHGELRTKFFREAGDEAEIMTLTIAAQAEQGADELWWQIRNQFINSRLARERALAASILAWIGDKQAIEALDQLCVGDPSEWVREHAQWAAEVARGEQSAKRFYRQLLHCSDPVLLSAQLEVLRAALTPTARWWRGEVERNEAGWKCASRTGAVIELFWERWTTTHSNPIKIYNRALDGYCRGEELESRHPLQLAPWWNP